MVKRSNSLPQSGQASVHAHQRSNTSIQGRSIFFDPVNPAVSLFQESLEDPSSISEANMNNIFGIHFPRVKTPPPEKRWPLHTRRNLEGNSRNGQFARQAVPARLKIPKPLPSVTYPEFFEVGSVPVRGHRSRSAPAADRGPVVPQTGSNTQGIPHSYSEMTQDPNDLPLSTPAKRRALDRRENFSVPSTNINHSCHVTGISKKLTGGSSSQDRRNNSVLHRDITRENNFCRLPHGVSTSPLPHKQVHASFEKCASNISSRGKDYTQDNLPEKVLDYSAAINVGVNLAQNLKRRDPLNENVEKENPAEKVEVSQAEFKEVPEEIGKSRALTMQPGFQKHLRAKEKSPCRIGDMDFTKEGASTQVPSAFEKKPISLAKSITGQPTPNQDPRSIYPSALVFRQLPPGRQISEFEGPPAAKAHTDRVSMEVVSEEVTVNDAPRFGNRVRLRNTVPDDIGNWSTICLPESKLLTKSEEEALETIACDLVDPRCEEAENFESIPEELVDPSNFEWMGNNEKDTVPDVVPSAPAATPLLAAEKQIQNDKLDTKQNLESTNECEEAVATGKPIMEKQISKSTLSHTKEGSAPTGISHPSITKKRGLRLLCPKCSIVLSRRGDLVLHLSRAHKAGPSAICYYCKACFSCLCESSLRQSHLVSCQKHKALQACFHCKFMFPSQKHLSDHILQKHPPLSIRCSKSNRRIISQTGTSRGTNTQKKDTEYRCSVCKCSYSTKARLRRHLMKDHADQVLLAGVHNIENGKL